MKLREVLKDFRERFNLTQLQAAEWMGLSPGTYRDYEQGRSEPNRITEEGIRSRIAKKERESRSDHIAKSVWGKEHQKELKALAASEGIPAPKREPTRSEKRDILRAKSAWCKSHGDPESGRRMVGSWHSAGVFGSRA